MDNAPAHTWFNTIAVLNGLDKEDILWNILHNLPNLLILMSTVCVFPTVFKFGKVDCKGKEINY